MALTDDGLAGMPSEQRDAVVETCIRAMSRITGEDAGHG
jgi:hypothetical protein